MASAGEGDSYTVLIYDYVPDILDKRGPYRAGHIEAAKNLVSSFPFFFFFFSRLG